MADSVLSVSVTEDGNLFNVSCAYGKLYCYFCYNFLKALVCAVSGSYYLTVDVSGIGSSSQRAFGSGGSDYLGSRAYGNAKSTNWNPCVTFLVSDFLVGKQRDFSKAGEYIDERIVQMHKSRILENETHIFVSPAYRGSCDGKCDIPALLSCGGVE